MARIRLLSLALLVAASGLPPAFAQPKPAEPTKGEDVVERMMKSTCFLIVEHTDRVRNGRMPYARGSGSLIVNTRQRKVVLTNYHVVGKYDDVWVMFPIRQANGDLVSEPQKYLDARKNSQVALPGKVIDRWPEKDLALIELKPADASYNFSRLRALPLADKSPRQASTVHTMGNPAASGLWSYTKGEVRTVFETTRPFQLEGEVLMVKARVIDTTNPLSGGDSGGPLVNERFEQVGVAQSVATNAAAVSSFIAIEEVWAFLKKNKLDKLVQTGRAVAAAKDETKDDKPPPSKPAETKPTPSDDEKKAQQERYAASKLKQAKQLSGAHRKEFLEEIIEKHPGTKAAAEAKELLEKGK